MAYKLYTRSKMVKNTEGQYRIISLLPAATEIVCLLGLEQSLVAISHDCDYPPSVNNLPKITSTFIDANLSSKEIDTQIKLNSHKGQSVFHIDQNLLAEINPDIILTQELCSVCAPSFTTVEKAARIINSDVVIFSLEPHSIEDIGENIKTVAKYTNAQKKAEDAIKHLDKKLNTLDVKLSDLHTKPTVLIIEWLEPIMIAAHWVPDMVARAGGKMLISKTGEKSQEIPWEEVLTIDPDIIIIAPCGFDIQRTEKEINVIKKKKGFQNLKAYKERKIFYMDGNAYVTRPGPRIIDGIEILSEILHPSVFPRKYGSTAWQEIK